MNASTFYLSPMPQIQGHTEAAVLLSGADVVSNRQKELMYSSHKYTINAGGYNGKKTDFFRY